MEARTLTAPQEPGTGLEAGVVRPRVAVRSLTLTAFRNYRRLRLELTGEPVVLTGPNGAGKTNLLEAVSYLGAGRGLRGARLADIDRRAGGAAVAPWAVAAVIEGPEDSLRIGTGRDASSATARRVVRVDEKPASGPAALARWVPVLWLTPAQDRLFADRPSARRRFLDKLVAGLDPAHAVRLSEYERALRERTRLLKASAADAAWLAALEQTMAAAGTAIAAARRQGAVEFTAAAGAGVGPFPTVRLTVAGDVEDWLADGPALAAEERLTRALADSRARDAELGGASVGPHRSDMVVTRPGSDLAAAALSTGEQKTLLVSIILGAARRLTAERGFAPVLLLDEIAAHFDSTHRAGLFEEVAALGAQAWMTGTDARAFAGLGSGAQHFTVEDGRVAAAAAP